MWNSVKSEEAFLFGILAIYLNNWPMEIHYNKNNTENIFMNVYKSLQTNKRSFFFVIFLYKFSLTEITKKTIYMVWKQNRE